MNYRSLEIYSENYLYKMDQAGNSLVKIIKLCIEFAAARDEILSLTSRKVLKKKHFILFLMIVQHLLEQELVSSITRQFQLAFTWTNMISAIRNFQDLEGV